VKPRIKNYDELMRQITEGASVRLVLSYAKCKLLIDGKEEKGPEAIGGMELKTWEWFAKGVIRNPKAYVTSSETVLISHPKYGYVHNYVKIKIFEDSSVEVTARYLKTGSFEIVMDETFLGKLGEGVLAVAA
jgi:hypothetical protein